MQNNIGVILPSAEHDCLK